MLSIYFEDLKKTYALSFLWGLYYIQGYKLSYYLNGKRSLFRRFIYNPFFMRCKSVINRSIIGKLNLYHSVATERFRDRNLTKFPFRMNMKPKWFLLGWLIIGICKGFSPSFMINEVLIKNQRFVLNYQYIDSKMEKKQSDKVLRYIAYSKNLELGRLIIANDVQAKLDSIIAAKSLEHINDTDNVNVNVIDNRILSSQVDKILTETDLIQYAKLMGSVKQDEIAFQAFYIAYLKNRSIKTNSELIFDISTI